MHTEQNLMKVSDVDRSDRDQMKDLDFEKGTNLVLKDEKADLSPSNTPHRGSERRNQVCNTPATGIHLTERSDSEPKTQQIIE